MGREDKARWMGLADSHQGRWLLWLGDPEGPFLQEWVGWDTDQDVAVPGGWEAIPWPAVQVQTHYWNRWTGEVRVYVVWRGDPPWVNANDRY